MFESRDVLLWINFRLIFSDPALFWAFACVCSAPQLYVDGNSHEYDTTAAHDADRFSLLDGAMIEYPVAGAFTGQPTRITDQPANITLEKSSDCQIQKSFKVRYIFFYSTLVFLAFLFLGALAYMYKYIGTGVIFTITVSL